MEDLSRLYTHTVKWYRQGASIFSFWHLWEEHRYQSLAGKTSGGGHYERPCNLESLPSILKATNTLKPLAYPLEELGMARALH